MSSSALSRNSLVAVIGSGTMGAGIAQVAALAGHAVAMYDSRTDAVPKAIQGIRQSFEKLVPKESCRPRRPRAHRPDCVPQRV